MNFKNKLTKAIEVAQEKTDKAQEKALDKLLENDNFVETQRSITAKETEIEKLATIMIQLNSITPFIASDGRKFSVNVFSLPIFGIGLSQVMGILIGSRSAFIDEKAMEYSAVSGISQLELAEAQVAIGNPSYYKDGIINAEVSGDYTKLANILEGIFLKLGLHEFKASEITREKYDLYFTIAENKALRQDREGRELAKLQKNATDFVLED